MAWITSSEYRRVSLVLKNLCCASCFARVAGELWGADPSKCTMGHEAMLVRGTIWGSKTKLEAGTTATPGNRNQDSQHMLNHPRGLSTENTVS